MSFSFNYPNTPYYLPTSSPIDISRVAINEPNPVYYKIDIALPVGLSIDASNGRIFGNTVFSSISVAKTYTVDASYSTGVVSTTLVIGVNFLPVFSYPLTPYIIQQNVAISIQPIYLISNIQGISYSLITTPPLTDINMNLSTTDGQIIGTPNIFSLPTTYTIRANNGGVTYDTSLVISVQTIPTISYPQSIYNLTQGVYADILPTVNIFNTGVTYTITDCVLPNGLFFNSSNGEILGTPTLPTTFRKYTVTVTNIIGSSSVTLTLNVSKVLLAPLVLADNIDTGLCLTNPIMSMRRKAEILKYKQNSANLTKNQSFSMAVQGKGPYAKRAWATQTDLGSNPNISGLTSQGNTIICNSNGVICSPTSSSDVPGKVTTLCYDPKVSLIGYGQPNRTRVNIGFKWPQRAWTIGDMGFPVGKAGN
jgi:filamentous hemagglutinin family protein